MSSIEKWYDRFFALAQEAKEEGVEVVVSLHCEYPLSDQTEDNSFITCGVSNAIGLMELYKAVLLKQRWDQ